MKKVLAFLMSALLIAGLFAGCSDTKADPGSDTTTAAAGTEDATVDSTSAVELPADYTVGVRTETDWKSAYIGLQYKLSAEQIMATEEELQQMMQIGADVLIENGAGDKLVDYAKITTIYEMMAADIYGNNVIVMAEKLAFSNITMEQYTVAMKTQMESLNVPVTFSDAAVQTVAGIDFTRLDCTMSVSDVSVLQTYLLTKMDNRMVAIVLSYQEAGTLEKLLEGFAPYAG